MRDRRSRAGQQLLQRQADEGGPGCAENQGRGRVDVHDPTESVQDEHGVCHVVDDDAAGQGSEVDQALAVQTPDQHAAGDDERERRQVHAREPADLEVVEQVGHPREEGRRDQCEGHLPVGAGKLHHARHEKTRGPQKDHVGIDKVDPERRSRAHDRQLSRRNVVRVEADVGRCVASFASRASSTSGSIARIATQADGHQSAAAGVLQHEDQPRRHQRAHADVLGISPAALDHEVVDRQLHRVGQAPPRHRDQHDTQAQPGRGAAPPGDVPGQPRQDQAGNCHQSGEEGQHAPAPPSAAARTTDTRLISPHPVGDARQHTTSRRRQ